MVAGFSCRLARLECAALRLPRQYLRPDGAGIWLHHASSQCPPEIHPHGTHGAGCPSEALAAFMGHWLRGEEPQDAYSTFCPAVYAKVLDEWITPLLRELGWSALSSQWVTE